MTEWRDIPGYEAIYQASADGQIRSVDRRVVTRDGIVRNLPGRLRRFGKPCPGCPYPFLPLRANGAYRMWKVHQLIALTFLGPAPFPGAQVCHDDGDPLNNTVANLRWGTPSDNLHDTVRHGRHASANKTHCPRSHEYTEANTRRQRKPDGNYSRRCRTCEKARSRAASLKRRSVA